MTNSIFNLNLWSHLNNRLDTCDNENKNNLIKKLQNLNLNHQIKNEKCLTTASGNKMISLKTENDIKNLEQNLYQNLTYLKINYLNHLFNSTENIKFNLDRSCLLNNIVKPDLSIETLFTSRFKEIYLFNNDWVYIPIMKIIQESKKVNQENDQQNVKNCEIILDSLKFIYLLELYRPDYMKQIPIIIRLVNLLNIYLTNTSIYLDKNISFYLYLILIHYVNTNEIDKLTFITKIPGVISFFDYYQHLLKNFDAESFGDSLFAHYVLIPIQQYCPVELRCLLWSEYLHVFKFIRFDLSLEFLLPFENYLQPCETDFKMIQLYSQALLNDNNFNLIECSQFAYKVAVKHVSSYLYDHLLLMNNETEVNFKKFLFKQFHNISNEVGGNFLKVFWQTHLIVAFLFKDILTKFYFKELKKDIFFFKTVSTENRIELYEVLPELRQKWLRKMITE
jgi:hypothetical protein